MRHAPRGQFDNKEGVDLPEEQISDRAELVIVDGRLSDGQYPPAVTLLALRR